VIKKNKQESNLGTESFKIQKDKNYVRPDVFETLINMILKKAELLELPQETLGSKKDLIDLISKNGGRLSSGWRNNIIGKELTKIIQS
jgi:ribonuclease D